MDSPPHLSPSIPDLILTNPSAGGGRAGRAVPALRQFFAENNWNAELVIASDAEDLARRARSAAAQGRKRILVVGGDGTFQVLLNALRNHPGITLGVIPAGGGNDLAKAIGLPCDPIRAAASLKTGEVRFIDAVRIRTAKGEERLYAGGGGVGLDADAAYLAATALRNWQGRLRYIAAALRALAGFQQLEIHATLYAKDWEGPRSLQKTIFLMAILNTPSYGAGLSLAPEAAIDDGMLNLIVVDKLNVFEILALLPALILFGQLHTRRAQRFSIESAHIETNRPALYHGDGEILGVTPLDIQVLPRFLRILVPAGSVPDGR